MYRKFGVTFKGTEEEIAIQEKNFMQTFIALGANVTIDRMENQDGLLFSIFTIEKVGE